jgi:uracil phosphoribosyltransferase
MQNVNHVDHPLLKHSLTILRDKNSSTEVFRRHTAIVSQIMIIEATRDLTLQTEEIHTPLAKTTGFKIDKSIVFVPVLRAGISMLIPAREFLPWAPVGFIGLERDEKTAVAREYYKKFPSDLNDKHVLVLDPMLATGGSLIDTITNIKKNSAKKISVICIVAAPEGINKLNERHPEVDIYSAAIDSHLDPHKYIYPGLGDFGDRYFGT